jgi:hypothetical protein
MPLIAQVIPDFSLLIWFLELENTVRYVSKWNSRVFTDVFVAN